MAENFFSNVPFVPSETSAPEGQSTSTTVEDSAARLNPFLSSSAFRPQPNSTSLVFGHPAFGNFVREGSATIFGSSSISPQAPTAERVSSFVPVTNVFQPSPFQGALPAIPAAQKDCGMAASEHSPFATLNSRRQEEELNATGGYLQLVRAGSRGSDGRRLIDAKLEEIKTTPLFSEQARLALGAGVLQNLGSAEHPFPQFGLLGMREETYNSSYTGVPQTLPAEDNLVFANMNAPWSAFICGSQGAGKSHSLSCLLENALLRTSSAGVNPRPLAGLVFHFDKFTSSDSTQVCEAAYLCSAGVPVRVLVSPSNFYAMNNLYRNLPGLPKNCPKPQVIPLRFREQQLNVARMMTLMAVKDDGQSPLYLEVLYKVLRDMSMENKGSSGLDYLNFKSRLNAQGFSAAQNGPLRLRLQLLEEFLASRDQSAESAHVLDGVFHSAQGSLTIVDLSCPFVNENDACALFNICLSIFMENRGECGRVIALDEAHKFLTKSGEAEKLTEQLISLIRQQRHLATRVIVATQEPTLSPSLLDLCNVSIVHRFNSPAWFNEMRGHLAGARLGSDSDKEELFEMIVGLQTGEALVFCPSALLDVGGGDVDRLKDAFIKIAIRSRVTVDGGKSIMASDEMDVVEAEEPAIEELLRPFTVPGQSAVHKPCASARGGDPSASRNDARAAAPRAPETMRANRQASSPVRVQHQPAAGPQTRAAARRSAGNASAASSNLGRAEYSRLATFLEREVTRSLLNDHRLLKYDVPLAGRLPSSLENGARKSYVTKL
ncbi:hypothetical protein A1O3_01105 [Capronia epimyces CBS 606.96]|uniref:AAA+ ATPase domain-containing protein n=1 Tax=Capronia epimyces CBS 606.96 TaxID=1182542 RepID=W9YJ43_9EURO|nr:uncharacterized protein A1O3_01105 [Capronia epimyces CBS 606.96]EXJ92553.1 hypothetical protein A1O3_01105 [Capronia epimyces CBS 606.96]